MTSAIVPPSANAVDAAPRGAFTIGAGLDLDRVAWRIVREEFAVVGDVDAALFGLHFEGVGEASFAEFEVMPVALTVGSDVHQCAVSGAAHQPVQQHLA